MGEETTTILVKHFYQGDRLPGRVLQEGSIETLPAEQARELLSTFPEWFEEVEVIAEAKGGATRARVKGEKVK
jgi:hypothetical protein